MSTAYSFDDAVARLKDVYRRAQQGDPEVADIRQILLARDEVIPYYQKVFAPENLPDLMEQEFREFLHFKRNRHCRLRKALTILLDQGRPIARRLNELVPAQGPAFVPRLSKAVLTPILLICHPDQYGVWNQMSEASMKALDLWPEFERGMPFGDRYEKVNEVLLQVAKAVEVDLWTLDALWWRSARLGDPDVTADEPIVETPDGDARFGLERHLQEFLRDNWDRTALGREWRLYEEDEEQVGYEYQTDIGRIDLLAQHKSEPRWLVIELKRNQTSDQTVGQVLRYMGWVKTRMAQRDDQVEGLVIAHEADDAIRFALAATSGVRLQLYEVSFRLREAPR